MIKRGREYEVSGVGDKRLKVLFTEDASAHSAPYDIVINMRNMNVSRDVTEAIRTLCYAAVPTRATAVSAIALGRRDADRVRQALDRLDATYPNADWEIQGCGSLAGLAPAPAFHPVAWYNAP